MEHLSRHSHISYWFFWGVGHDLIWIKFWLKNRTAWEVIFPCVFYCCFFWSDPAASHTLNKATPLPGHLQWWGLKWSKTVQLHGIATDKDWAYNYLFCYICGAYGSPSRPHSHLKRRAIFSLLAQVKLLGSLWAFLLQKPAWMLFSVLILSGKWE